MTAARRVADRPGWLTRTARDHRRALRDAWQRLLQQPFGTLLTGLVIGITLSLPAALDAVIAGLDTAGYSWEGAYQASLFLKDSVSTEQGQKLAADIGHKPGIASSRYVSRDAALAEFRAHSDYGEALDLLQDNPLPAVIVVTPERHQSRDQAAALLNSLAKLPEVDQARLDQQWLDRLYAILGFVQQLVLGLAVALALTVVVVIANTVRLDVERRREEILVLKQVGATDAYIRRPFLYTGLAYGLLGALLALVLVSIALGIVAAPLRQLFKLNLDSGWLAGLPPRTPLLLLIAGPLLGWLTSHGTVSWRLIRLEPIKH